MANDRIFLTCRVCNESATLVKYYPVGGFIGGSFHPNPLALADYLEKHMDGCHPNRRCQTLGGDVLFDLSTESVSFPAKASKFLHFGEIPRTRWRTRLRRAWAALLDLPPF